MSKIQSVPRDGPHLCSDKLGELNVEGVVLCKDGGVLANFVKTKAAATTTTSTITTPSTMPNSHNVENLVSLKRSLYLCSSSTN